MSARELLRAGNLREALAELQQEVRGKPADAELRVFLFQLLAVMGQWERALTQLDVVAEMDSAALAMVHMCRDAVRCEALRAEVFQGQRSPVVFGEPEEWVAWLAEALRLTSAGEHDAAQALRAQAFEAAPEIAGRVSRHAAAEQIHTFNWIADADNRLGPVLEAIVDGKYYWIPMHRVRQIVLEPPTDLRDLVWTLGHFTWSNGGTSVGLIPTRYAGSEASADGRVALARQTEWMEPYEGYYEGSGQRLLTTDEEEYPLLELRQVQLDTSPPTENAESGSVAHVGGGSDGGT